MEEQNKDLLEQVGKLQKQVDEFQERERQRQDEARRNEILAEGRKKAEAIAQQMVESEMAEEQIADQFVQSEIPKAYEAKKQEMEMIKSMLGKRFNVNPGTFSQENSRQRINNEMYALMTGRKDRLEYNQYGNKAIGDGVPFSLDDASWNPTGAAAEALRLADKLGGAWNGLRKVEMPTNPFKVPSTIAAVTATKQGRGGYKSLNDFAQATDDIGDVATLDAELITTYYPLDRVMAEDSGPNAAGEILYAVTQGLVKAREETILQGGAGTDSGLLGAAGGAATVAGETDFLNALATLGELAANPSDLVLIVGIETYFNLLQHIEELKNRDYTNNNPVDTGVVNRWHGVEIRISSGLPAAAAGSTYATEQPGLLAHKRAAVLGDRRSINLETERYAKADRIDVVGTTRAAYAPATEAGTGLVNVTFGWGGDAGTTA